MVPEIFGARADSSDPSRLAVGDGLFRGSWVIRTRMKIRSSVSWFCEQGCRQATVVQFDYCIQEFYPLSGEFMIKFDGGVDGIDHQ